LGQRKIKIQQQLRRIKISMALGKTQREIRGADGVERECP